MALFSKTQRSMAQVYSDRYRLARNNLLLVVILSVVNIIMAVAGTGRYFLFSATVPYILTELGLFFSGRLPEEVYEGMEGMTEGASDSSLYLMLGIAAVILLVYFVAFLLSGRMRGGWLIFAGALFVIDTLALIFYYGFSVQMITDYFIRIYLLVTLALGINGYLKLRRGVEN